MSLLTIEELNYELPDKVLYEDGSLRLNRGEHMGLTGRNGVGKSTLIKIIIGETLADSGRITWQPNARIGYLEQYQSLDNKQTIREFLGTSFQALFEIEKEIRELYEEYSETLNDSLLERAGKKQGYLEESGFYEADIQIEKMAFGLGIVAIGLEKPLNLLSGGQRSKVLLAKLLLENPDVLLLDEPTNYLDDEHVTWLATFLNDFKGSFIVISHDFDFLDTITTCICDIEFGKLSKYPGNLTKAIQLKEEANAIYLKDYHAQQEKIDKLEAYIRKYKAGTRSTMAKSREKQLNRMERLSAPERIAHADFVFPASELLAANVIETSDLQVGYQLPLLGKINLLIQLNEKIVLKGFNGIGKSTLLKTIVGQIAPLKGKVTLPDKVVINYFSQDLTWENPSTTPFDFIRSVFPDLNDKEIRGHLARSGIHDDNVKKQVKFLSGGEQTKVKLCVMTLRKSNLLILDEPTNHLDAMSKRKLREAIKEFKGTVVLVSHEQEFYDNLVDRVIDVESLII